MSRRLKKELKDLRRYYRVSIREGMGASEWLRDNFYLLEREGKSALHDLQTCHPVPGGDLPRIYLICEKAAAYGCKVGSALSEVLEKEGGDLTIEEIEKMGAMLRAAFLHIAAGAAGKPGDEATARMGTAVSGIRELPAIDLQEYIDHFCRVESIFAKDPAGVYTNMDESSRAMYRKLCAKMARKRKIGEEDMAAELIEKSEKSLGRRRHVGYWLLEDSERTKKLRRNGRIWLFLKWLLPVLPSAAVGWLTGRWWLILILYLPMIEVIRPLIDRLSCVGVEPCRLPRLELEGRIPEEAPTLIVVSQLVPSPERAGEVARRMFQLAQTGGPGAVKVCLLADLKQSDLPSKPEDKPAVEALTRAVRELNRRYGNKFILAVRRRSRIATQRAYAGWERKRGAIMQLVRAIKKQENDFLTLEGDREFLRRVKYIIALDADTQLLMDSDVEMVAAALHPLNRPVIDPAAKTVTEGFGILTPKISTDLDSAAATAFSRLMSGTGGVTAYDTLSGDFYQDRFGRSIFAGKGLIDVDAYFACMDDFLPEERVLSHDILEGEVLRCGYMSDVEVTDGCPSSGLSFLSRLHRWIRGDWQNILWLFPRIPKPDGRARNPFHTLSKYMLLDNLRRSVTEPMAVVCLLLVFAVPPAAPYLALTALLSQAAPGLFSAIMLLWSGGVQMLSRRYYSRVMPAAFTALAQAVFSCVILVQTAGISINAIARALWRQFVSGRQLLEWVTAADSESGGRSFVKTLLRCWPSVIIGALLLFAPGSTIRLAALLTLLAPFFLYFTGSPTKSDTVHISGSEREQLKSYAASMWRFYDELCGRHDNYLPPDNIQEAPVYAIAHRTSPTNIGLMLLCVLSARDLGLIDTPAMAVRVENTISTVERLEKWHGNLLNWYDTRTLKPLFPRSVSTVDSGNFVCCLLALREGLAGYLSERKELAGLIQRIDTLISDTDLTPLYNKRRRLFHIGYDMEQDSLAPCYYDLLMSEARMTSYFAIAARQVPKKHWGALGRTLAREDGYVGLVSWTGTMFEYFMPHLLLPVRENSLCFEALRFCIHCQRKRGRAVKAPFGCSESGFYAFDPQLNYQYKAHGVQHLGLKRQLGDEFVVSPYSSFLVLPMIPQTALKNLNRMERMGLTGRFGFYEAVDFTPSRAGAAGYSVVRSYMAHHVGMSLLSVLNLLEDNVLQKRFMSASVMGAAKELLEEKIPAGTSVFEDVIERDVPEKPGRAISEIEEFDTISPRQPRVHLLSNGEWTLAVTDSGSSITSCQGVDVLRRSEDLLRRPLGVFAIVETKLGRFSMTQAPDYHNNAGHHVEFAPDHAAFFAERNGLECGMKVEIHESIPCEIRRFALKNRTPRRMTADLLIYMEPALARQEDDGAHPAFSRLFIRGEYDAQSGLLLFSRRPREGESSPLHMAVGFDELIPFTYDFDREKVLERPDGVASLLRENLRLTGSAGVPDPCAAFRIHLEIPQRSQRNATLLMTVGRSRDEAVARLLECRGQPMKAARAPLFDGGLDDRLAESLLPELLFPCRDAKSRLQGARENTAGLQSLWGAGISGDLPLVLIEIKNEADLSRAEPYIRLHRRLRQCGIKYDLALAYRQGGEYTMPLTDGARRLITALGSAELISHKGGIHLVDLVGNEEILTTLRAAARYIAPDSVTSVNLPVLEFVPVELLPASPAPGAPEGIRVEGGVFHENGFTVTGRPGLPWCHVLANEAFGTLVSDSALGYTWALNSRENKLTPWYNDTRTDNRGELLILRVGDRFYDLINGSSATYFPDAVQYRGKAGEVEFTVRVDVKGSAKRIETELTAEEETDMQMAYYTEPVLGVSRGTARQITSQWEGGRLLLRNRFNTAVPGCAVLTAEGGADSCICDRAAFLCGRWDEHTLCPLPDPCAAVIVARKLPPKRSEKIRFILTFGETPEQAFEAVDFSPADNGSRDAIHIFTDNEELNHLVNTWLPAQIENSRINGRTGFYQCGGAFGFRDQLQDICAQLLWNPGAARRHILRSAAHQFEEGDVLHWWHPLPSGDAGVRTRCSDDMLWLPYAVCEYVQRTGDVTVLNEEVPYLSAPELGEERERFFTPVSGEKKGTVYDHCLKAISRVRTGARGLPLIGTCDWNDGLSAVGEAGTGESVWLAQFAAVVFERMAAVCMGRGDNDRARELLDDAAAFKKAVDEKAWGGKWYLRAFMDDGTPLGAPGNSEMEIDLLPQAFATLSGMPDRERRRESLREAAERLVDRELGIIKLFTPPFDKFDPGYIRGYPPGVRENGGQYTHGSLWLIEALFLEGKADGAYELLQMISPVTRSKGENAAVYQLEPYAIAADVYASPAAPGRGGWSLYTGSAGWYYRIVISTMLGILPRGGRLELEPHLPSSMRGYRAQINLGGSKIDLTVEKAGTSSLTVDGEPALDIHLDGKPHTVKVCIAEEPPPEQ